MWAAAGEGVGSTGRSWHLGLRGTLPWFQSSSPASVGGAAPVRHPRHQSPPLFKMGLAGSWPWGTPPEAAFFLRTSRISVYPVQRLFPEQPRGTHRDMSHFLDSNLSQLLSHFGLGLSKMYLLFQVHFYFLPGLSPCQVCEAPAGRNSRCGAEQVTRKRPTNSQGSSFLFQMSGREVGKEPISQVGGDLLPLLRPTALSSPAPGEIAPRADGLCCWPA